MITIKKKNEKKLKIKLIFLIVVLPLYTIFEMQHFIIDQRWMLPEEMLLPFFLFYHFIML